ncbi:hypothetical protein PspCFBP13508_08740 [Pseudomonas sp. CFBP13508]|nr:hypothetical protein PspCFBP13508_08740 [Pseudomonas sp. CFBP13508]
MIHRWFVLVARSEFLVSQQLQAFAFNGGTKLPLFYFAEPIVAKNEFGEAKPADRAIIDSNPACVFRVRVKPAQCFALSSTRTLGIFQDWS